MSSGSHGSMWFLKQNSKNKAQSKINSFGHTEIHKFCKNLNKVKKQATYH